MSWLKEPLILNDIYFLRLLKKYVVMLCFLRMLNIRKLNKFIMFLSRNRTVVVILLLLQKNEKRKFFCLFFHVSMEKEIETLRGKTITKGKFELPPEEREKERNNAIK